MLPMRRNKDQIGTLNSKKSRQPLFNSKTGIKTLKHYNSCFHQKVFSRKDASLGPTTYISSVKKQELTKTLQANQNLPNNFKRFKLSTSLLQFELLS